jgi:hypothetical protein
LARKRSLEDYYLLRRKINFSHRKAVLARITKGSLVMTNSSVTLQETGLGMRSAAGPHGSARNKIFALAFVTHARKMKVIGG